MEGEGVFVSVFEDETDIGERWLRALGGVNGLEPADRVFTTLSEVHSWIEEQKRSGRPWLMVTDLDVTTSDTPGPYLKIQEELQEERPTIARYPGILLVERLRREQDLRRVLVVTGVNYGPVHAWLEEIGCRSLLKPVWSREVAEAAAELAGGTP